MYKIAANAAQLTNHILLYALLQLPAVRAQTTTWSSCLFNELA